MTAAIDTRVTTSEAARASGVSEQTIRTWVRAGILPAERTPLGALIDARDLGRLIQAREEAARHRERGH